MNYLLPKTRKEIAQEYGISPKTLQRWLVKHKIKIGTGLVIPKDQLRIYQKFGFPHEIHMELANDKPFEKK